MPEWKEYNGSDEQIAEILNARSGFILRDPQTKFESKIMRKLNNDITLANTEYLICKPHPLADMITRQAQTGQPVWIRTLWDERVYGYRYLSFPPTTTPDWNIPNAEYSFTPFEDK